jgi:hypothetical protein
VNVTLFTTVGLRGTPPYLQALASAASRAITESCGWGDKERRIPFNKKKKKGSLTRGRQKETMHPVPENKVVSLEERAKDEQKPFLEQLLQEGARKLLQAAIENEVIEYIQFHKDRRDENGHRLVVRNGHLPERKVVSGVGPIPVCQPRVRHRDQGRFTSAILPKFATGSASMPCFQSFTSKGSRPEISAKR